ncbi:MAG: acyl-CoA synthetase [Spirochaetaceae bacterium]|nr:MAG: acyl-CoA synthetase [Spirochaetaceae bacterium]
MDSAHGLGRMLEEMARKQKKRQALLFDNREVSYRELDENANKIANGLQSLGITRGDRVAMMLPNIPDFVYSFFGIQKLGAVAVPFNTMYKGREIIHILNDCEAKAIITMTNFANLINEIQEDVPSLQHIILTGQRTMVFVSPDSTVNVQMVVGKDRFASGDEAFRVVGELLIDTLKSFGVEAWYKHRGGVRCGGRKIAIVLVSEVENLLVINCITFLGPLKTDDFFRVVWVAPEVKDKVMEPTTSVEEQTGTRPSLELFKDALLAALQSRLGISAEEGQLKRDELFGYEKTRALADKK